MFKQLLSDRKDTPLYKQMTLFIPKADRDFIEAVRVFLKLKYPNKNFNWFLMLCLKHTINTMFNPTQTTLFKDIYYEIAGFKTPPKPEEIQELRRKKKNAKTRKKSNSQHI